MKSFVLRNWFVLSLPVVVLLAFLIPDAGAKNGWLQSQITTKFGVALIFLFQGLTIPTSALHHGLKNWRLHLLVQGFIFVLFPALGMIFDAVAGSYLPPDLRIGFLYLCVLPSTISTSPVLTTMAGGNTVGAVFNAVLSNLLGMVLTPLWSAWLMHASGQNRPLGPVLQEVALYLLLPLAIGQIIRQKYARWIDPRKKRFGNSSSALILFIVFAAFCNSVKTEVWQKYGWGVTLKTAGGVVILFFLATALADGLAILLRLGRGDKIVAVFSSPHKTLASGVPMAEAIFGQSHPGFTLILLPLMFYHPLQLFVCGLIADRYARSNPHAHAVPSGSASKPARAIN